MDVNFEQKVREKAYEIWMAAGMDGAAHDHWVAAEQVVMNETAEPKTRRAAAAKTSKTTKTTAKPAAKAKGPVKNSAKATAKGSSATH